MNSTTHKYKILLDKFLNKEASEEEIELLAEWIKGKETPAEFDTYFKQLWDTAPDKIDSKLEREIWDIIALKIKGSKKRFRIKPAFYRAAAAILLPACVSMGIYIYVTYDSEKESYKNNFEISADIGQKASATLPDGTKVWINSATKLSYYDNKNERRVYLEGEAYFEVEAKHPKKKFIVSCNGLFTEALGTTFDIKGYASDETVSVTLIEGKVKVFNDKGSAILNPNQCLSLNKHSSTFTRTDIKDIGAIDYWRRNVLEFRSATLGEIAKILERTYGVTITFKDEKLKDVSFSGTIRNTNLNNVFHIISLTYPISYEIKGNEITVNKDRFSKKR